MRTGTTVSKQPTTDTQSPPFAPLLPSRILGVQREREASWWECKHVRVSCMVISDGGFFCHCVPMWIHFCNQPSQLSDKYIWTPPTGLHFPCHPSLFALSAEIQSSFSPSHLQNSWKTSAPTLVSCSLKWTGLNCQCLLSYCFLCRPGLNKEEKKLPNSSAPHRGREGPSTQSPHHYPTSMFPFNSPPLLHDEWAPHLWASRQPISHSPRTPSFHFPSLLQCFLCCYYFDTIRASILPYLYDLSNFPFISQW